MPEPSRAQRECLEIAAGNVKNDFTVRLSGRSARSGPPLVRNGWATVYDYFCGAVIYQITDAGRAAIGWEGDDDA